jgi:hypothetical protein
MVQRAIERDRRLTKDMSQADLATLKRITDDMFRRAEELMQEESGASD